MEEQTENGWVMLASMGLMSALVLGLLVVPGAGPGPEALTCDRKGGYWSSADGQCHKTDSPLAGMSP